MNISQDQYLIIDCKEDALEQITSVSYALVTSDSIIDTKFCTINDLQSDVFLAEILPLLDTHIVVTYNASHQISILNTILNEAGYNPFNGLVLDLETTVPTFFPSMNNYELQGLAVKFGLPTVSNNSELDSIILLAELFLYQHQYVVSKPLLLIQRLIETYNSMEHLTIRSYLLSIESNKLNTMGSSAVPNDATAFLRMILKKKLIPEIDQTENDPEALLNFFTKKDREKIFDDFEIRPQQQKMLEQVHNALTEENHLLVEAGTGTGKTLAYLLPLLYFSILNTKRVVVATNTILLQRQIFERDIPLLEKIYDIPFHVALMKGRSHYICLRKFNYYAANNFNSSSSNTNFIAKVLVWLSMTQTGDGEELHFMNKKDWQQISSDSETCLNKNCTCFSHCFYHFAKEKASCANIIITNHSLVFSDIKSDHQILPAYNHIVFDEAHHIENEATRHLGIQIQYLDVKQKISYLYKDHKNGVVLKAKEYLKLIISQGQDNYVDILDILESFTKDIVDFTVAFDECIASIHQWLRESYLDKSESNDSIRFTAKAREEFPYIHLIDNIKTQLNSLITHLNNIEKNINNNEEIDYQASEHLRNILLQKKPLQQTLTDIQFFFENEDEAFVYWFEVNRSAMYINLTFYAVPINIGTILYEKLFSDKACCILTSATLTVKGSFEYVIKRLGLRQNSKESIETLVLDSPFDYQKQCLVCIPSDIPSIRDEKLFVTEVSELISKLVILTQGKTLLLFTSNRLLTLFYQALEVKLDSTGIKLLAQNIDTSSRSKLIEQFTSSDKAILLGSNSFWEGVDMPGKSLVNVFIIKLPFWPPNMPIIEARTEQLEKQKRNSFIEYSVPEAVIRFKQGFGRLIRTKTDKGTVVIFDRRIIDSRYGSFFIKSLPNPKLVITKENELFHEISEWNN